MAGSDWLMRCGIVVVLAALVVAGQAVIAAGAGLPDGRRYELVSPPDKGGGEILADSAREQAAVDGSAMSFASLEPFGDPAGTGVETQYVAQRSTSLAPGSNGWSTHPITPPQAQLPDSVLFSPFDPRYLGDFSSDLNVGVFGAWAAVTGDPNLVHVPNLYVRGDLLSGGPGNYQAVTACPLCALTSTPLSMPGTNSVAIDTYEPWFAGMSADGGVVVFESRQQLTGDTPPQPASCQVDNFTVNALCRMHVFEWDQGTVRLAGVLPDGTAADDSFAGDGASHGMTPHVISDGTDGHTRIVFTQPTNSAGQTSSQVPVDQQGNINFSSGGNVFLRVDHTSTVQLNASERTDCADHNPCNGTPEPDTFAPAFYQDASVDGTRVFFMTAQALTDDAPADGQSKIYVYDATKPAGAHLTLLTRDGEPHDGALATGMMGASADGHYAYMIVFGQLVAGRPLGGLRVYLWHDGTLTHIGPIPFGELAELETTDNFYPPEQRVTPDGRFLLFATVDGAGFTGYNQGTCLTNFGGSGCRELYVFSADTGRVVCASCNPSRAPATQPADANVRENGGGSQTVWHENRALSADGSRVFFSSAEALVPEDVNGVSDAYEYDVRTGRVFLLSTGIDSAPSWFLDASASGDNAFIVTRQQLVGWDTDGSYDVYDARVNGGFPEPPPLPSVCGDESCRGPLPPPSPAFAVPASVSLHGAGNIRPARNPCKKGLVLKRVKGKRKCVKPRPRRVCRIVKRRGRRVKVCARKGSVR